MIHISVLLHEALDGLDLKEGQIFVDATVNSGGHSSVVLEKFGKTIKIVGIDVDAEALMRAKVNLIDPQDGYQHEHDVHLVESNFRNLDTALDSIGVGQVDAFLFDLGVSSNQIDDSGRGFSFKRNEPLLMTLKSKPQGDDTTAYEVVNEWAEDTLADIIFGFGEEKFARRIARGIVEARAKEPIKTSEQLAEIITQSTPLFYRFKKIHPATRTFQAIRIAVNDELTAIKEGLRKAFERLKPGGRMAVISFHSLEDRIVKHYFKDLVDAGTARAVTKKPIAPTEQEQAENPRSRSAKLRIIEKILV